MKVSYRWLARLFPPGAFDDLTPDELARRLTAQGFTVDEVRPAFAPFEGVVLGRVVDAGPHPDADRLTLCEVEAGDGTRPVVCGAPNVEVGAIYGYATVGSRLPGDRQIRRARIRGIESQGMLCSAPELGLDALGGAEGIWKVRGASEADLGRSLRDVLELDDTILEIDVASNRGDALSHLGIAREIQWILGKDLMLSDPVVGEAGEPAAVRCGVEIEDVEGCPRYFGRLIDGVFPGASPAWLQTRLVSVGQRPVSDVVDVTNYVMLELGQPLHPFDWERIRGGRIVVRRAREGERFTTLDGRERTLDPEITLICDAEGPVAIGGVMGGLESEVSEKTRVVFLEGAHFDPARVGRAARRLGLPSEAATRFARGVDPRLPEAALDRAAAMIAGMAGGRVAPGLVGDDPRPPVDRPRIDLRLARYETLVGCPVSEGDARGTLQALGFPTAPGESQSTLSVAVPSWRSDVTREADVVEEVARLVGYDSVPVRPLPAPPLAPGVEPAQRLRQRVSAAARGAGFDEAVTASFVGEGVPGAGGSIDNLVEIRNPISKADRFLRPFVSATLTRAVIHNLKRGAGRVKLFEIGHAFRLRDGEVEETEHLALAAAGSRFPLDWSSPDSPAYDLFDLEGEIEDVLSVAGVAPTFRPGGRPWLHPGRQAELAGGDGTPLGFCGEIHPAIAEGWGIEGRLYVAEIVLASLGSPESEARVQAWSREPVVERDLALVVPDRETAAAVLEAVGAAGLDHLVRTQVFDRYSGEQVPAGHHSLGLRLTFEADRTLTDEEVDAQVNGLLDRLRKERGYERR